MCLGERREGGRRRGGSPHPRLSFTPEATAAGREEAEKEEEWYVEEGREEAARWRQVRHGSRQYGNANHPAGALAR